MPTFGRQRHGQRTLTPTRIEDFLCEELLADPMVDVDELNDLLRDPSPLAIFDHDDQADADDEPPGEPESPTARAAKLAGLAIALAVLCGSILTAVFLDRHRAATGEARPQRQITGIAALAGFTMMTTPPATGTILVGDTVTTSRAVRDPRDARRVTRHFYDSLASAPDEALAMLGGGLRGGRTDELTDAFARVDAVTVHRLGVMPDGMVQAVITVTRSDSRRYRVTQLLRVDTGPPAKITAARLLSAQRSPGQE